MAHREQQTQLDQTGGSGGQQKGEGHGMSYLRFTAMITSAVVVMYALMYVNTYAFDHVQWSESRLFMALTMGGAMALIMLGWMLKMYRNSSVNLAIVAISVVLIAGAVYLDRSQVTVQDDSFMSAMIPHHSIAILRAERAGISDVRVCRLAVEISEAQRREIAEMEWLITDIAENGVAATPAEAARRSVPEFDANGVRTCPAG